MLGLMSSTDLESRYSEKSLRTIFWKYPQGKAILTYLLSLMDSEETDKPKFGWFEQAHAHAESTTATSGSLNGGGAGPFTDSAVTTSQAAAGFSWTSGTTYGVFVADASKFRVDDVVWLKRVPNAAASAYLDLYGVVTALDTSSNYILVVSTETVASVSNDTDANSIAVMNIGKSASEGDRSREGGVEFPIEPENYTQIFRETVGPFTRNALKAGVRFDKTGTYASAVKQASLRITESVEMASFFSKRGVQTVTNQNGKSVPRRQTGGVLWFLEQYELASGGSFGYRPGGSAITSSAWQTEELKRVIKVNGTITCAQLEGLLRRAFENTADGAFEKLLVCGSTLYDVFQQYFALKSIKTTTLKTKEESYGMTINMWESPWGTLYLKSHPLFQRTALRTSGFVLDVGCLGWMDLQDSEITLLKNRQNNDEDGRKDEFLGEGGLIVKAPENHLYLEGVTGITV
jgi:hypothetical protein